MLFEFSDVALVPFPFTSHTASKKRPAVVVSSKNYNSTKPDIVVMAVTSQMRATAALGEVWLNDWKAAGLLKPSAIKPVFATMEQALVIRILGRLTQADAGALKRAIRTVLD